MINQLETDCVRSIVQDFMSKDLLFTALDISNEAKKSFPALFHREVRDVVRSMFPDMEKQGWARNDISVTLADGSQQTALLYYPLSASWDLDGQYDAQKRSQDSSKPVYLATVANAVLDAAGAVATNVSNTAHDLWKSMFQGKPSLFPAKK